MDGRWLRVWSATGCVLAGVVGCNKNAVQTSEAQPVTGVPTQPAAAKPLWGNATPQVQPAPVAAEPAKKGPVRPETEVAFADVRMAVALDEKTPESSRSGALDLARQGYQKALHQDPKNKAALLGLARYYSRVNEHEKSIETYQKCLTYYPGDREVTYEVARVYARWQDWPNATQWCERALKLDPENLTYRKTMGFCLACGGRWEDAFRIFLSVMPEAQARYTMARVMEDQNQVDASRLQLQLALKADPNFENARDFLAELDRGTQPPTAADANAVQQAGYNSEK